MFPRRTYRGLYRPTFPQKYKGDPSKIVYRSSWEAKFFKWCDFNEAVLEWSSEEFFIPYISPLDRKAHRYFPDVKIRIRTRSGAIETWVIEIKPYDQTQEPQIPQRKTKQYFRKVTTYLVNDAKWKYARTWCEERAYKFVILTEKDLGIKG